MITHDLEEAIYLADKIFLMTSGPGAAVAEVAENPLPEARGRTDPRPARLRAAQPHHRCPGQPQQELGDGQARFALTADTEFNPRVRPAAFGYVRGPPIKAWESLHVEERETLVDDPHDVPLVHIGKPDRPAARSKRQISPTNPGLIAQQETLT
jgi:hypothetical protein